MVEMGFGPVAKTNKVGSPLRLAVPEFHFSNQKYDP